MVMKTTSTRQTVNRLIFAPLLSGMITAQVIATLFVYLSNQRIFESAEAIEKAGFLPIPNGQAMVPLNSFGAAFWGGLFFTLSIGIGLTLFTWGACRIWGILFARNRWVLIGYGAVWAILLTWVNINGLVIFPSLFCIAIPAVTGWITIRSLDKIPSPKPNLWFVPVITLVLLTGLWSTQRNDHLFTTIRDHILLSNTIGRSVNDFYYRYTLYAAESFKPFQLKKLRTCKLVGFEEETRKHQLIKRLILKDVLTIPQVVKPDLLLVSSLDKVTLESLRGETIETTLEKFLIDTDGWLKKFSQASDRYRQFRKITFYGLTNGFPILLYIICYGLLCIVLGFFMRQNMAVTVGSSLCLLLGILLFLPMLKANPVEINKDGLDNALTSDQWPHRVAALRFTDSKKIEIANHPSYHPLVTSPLVVERYWLARALGRSRVPSTYDHLLTLLNDPHPNVVCQAIFALGARRQRLAIDAIKQKLTNTDHWYVQWYGYGALRRLGWHQGLSK